MLYLLISAQFVALPSRKDALLGIEGRVKPKIEASGSLGLFMGDSKCHQTYPNQTLLGDKKIDWCSNIASNKEENPWILFSFPNKAMKLTGYAVRNGCCYYYECCCDPETGNRVDYYCCCRLYSFSLQGSNDNKTWVTIHKIEKESTFYYCKLNTYDFPETRSYNYVRFVLDEQWPGCPKCMQINQIELYGTTVDSYYSSYEQFDSDENDETISIIGKVKRS